MTHKTKGIVLRTIAYGETSVITTVYTELFGMQSYIVKGIRKSSKTSQGKSVYFQPGAILDMEAYHNDLKNLQFIKEFQWAYLYESVFFNVIKNAVAIYMIELLQRSLKQPEANAELFYFVEECLKQLDKATQTMVANMPLFFTLKLASESGVRIHGEYSERTPILDLQEGMFVTEQPGHAQYLEGNEAVSSSEINQISSFGRLDSLQLNRDTRRTLLQAYQEFFVMHIPDFGELRSLQILQEVL